MKPRWPPPPADTADATPSMVSERGKVRPVLRRYSATKRSVCPVCHRLIDYREESYLCARSGQFREVFRSQYHPDPHDPGPYPDYCKGSLSVLGDPEGPQLSLFQSGEGQQNNNQK